ncbi:hypothetical protein KCP73_06035 [Salmonella enterica subsp. enterica]|nr:hypothetical protein KCP73_06035 [Salmonella enterica subsp. enterica]
MVIPYGRAFTKVVAEHTLADIARHQKQHYRCISSSIAAVSSSLSVLKWLLVSN